MKMKKLLSLLTVSALVVGLMGCASSDTSTSSEPADTKEEYYNEISKFIIDNIDDDFDINFVDL